MRRMRVPCSCIWIWFPGATNGQGSETLPRKTEYDVVSTLRKLGHDVQALGEK